MWRPLDQGRIFINIDGFHLLTAGDLVTWDWQSIDLGQMVQRGQFAMVGNSEQGRVSYVIESDLAELVFFLWAAHRQPQHPQLYQRVWLLPEAEQVRRGTPPRRHRLLEPVGPRRPGSAPGL
ncbi:hypothetical protein [Acidipropionibacterium acidipropionici]|uniref:hypothetical protein n=1 Tax=Acidipropionibacterium acidipropionici TaxID=1748 RepID=UPI00110B0CEC|nr:hypothetical protein [Acidipropionibacterium acidipropionici]QCV93874.1 hypothetical protein FEZ30_00015 [Acidipropionibacterium acidipropionici]